MFSSLPLDSTRINIQQYIERGQHARQFRPAPQDSLTAGHKRTSLRVNITDEFGNSKAGGGNYEQCLNTAAFAQLDAGFNCLECVMRGRNDDSDFCQTCCSVTDPDLASDDALFVCELDRCCIRVWALPGGFVETAEAMTAGARGNAGECRNIEYRSVCQDCARLGTVLNEPIDCTKSGVDVPEYGAELTGDFECADGTKVVPEEFAVEPPLTPAPAPLSSGSDQPTKDPDIRCECKCKA